MMGVSHALSAVPAWLTGCVIAQHLGMHQTPVQVAVGTVLCVGGSLLPDIDMSGAVIKDRGGATIARTFGRIGLVVAEVVEKTSLAVYTATRTRLDEPRENGHRTLTHTPVFNLALGAGVWGLCAWLGRWAVGVILLLLTLAAVRAVAPTRWRHKTWWQLWSLTAVITGSAAVAVTLPPAGYPLLGLAVGAGCLVHLAGDWLTVHGVPLYWPLTVRGKRWWMSRLYPIKAGCVMETRVLRWVFLLSGGATFAVLVDPHLLQAFGLWLAQSP